MRVIQSLEKAELPKAVYLGSPAADLSNTGDSKVVNEGLDRWLVSYSTRAYDIYAKGAALGLKDPMVSPIYGRFENFPPTFLVTGSRDLLRSDTDRVNTKLQAANVQTFKCDLEGLSHAGYIFEPDLPESVKTYELLDKFLRQHLKEQ